MSKETMNPGPILQVYYTAIILQHKQNPNDKKEVSCIKTATKSKVNA